MTFSSFAEEGLGEDVHTAMKTITYQTLEVEHTPSHTNHHIYTVTQHRPSHTVTHTSTCSSSCCQTNQGALLELQGGTKVEPDAGVLMSAQTITTETSSTTTTTHITQVVSHHHPYHSNTKSPVTQVTLSYLSPWLHCHIHADCEGRNL